MKCGMTLCGACGKKVHYDERGYIEVHDHADELCVGSGKNVDRDVDAAPKRVPVDFRYDSINPTFFKWMARIGGYASEKYGSWDQYKTSRLTGDKSPVNHIYEHLRSYVEGEPYDHFDGDVRWHLVAVAYNAMMEFFYCTKFGFVKHPLHIEEALQGMKLTPMRGTVVSPAPRFFTSPPRGKAGMPNTGGPADDTICQMCGAVYAAHHEDQGCPR